MVITIMVHSMTVSLFTQRRTKTEHERCMKINSKQLWATINRQSHLNDMKDRLRQRSIQIKERKRKWTEELSQTIHDELNGAFVGRQNYLAETRNHLKCQALETAKRIEKRDRKAVQELSKRLDEEIEQACLKRQGRLSEVKDKAMKVSEKMRTERGIGPVSELDGTNPLLSASDFCIGGSSDCHVEEISDIQLKSYSMYLSR